MSLVQEGLGGTHTQVLRFCTKRSGPAHAGDSQCWASRALSLQIFTLKTKERQREHSWVGKVCQEWGTGPEGNSLIPNLSLVEPLTATLLICPFKPCKEINYKVRIILAAPLDTSQEEKLLLWEEEVHLCPKNQVFGKCSSARWGFHIRDSQSIWQSGCHWAVPGFYALTPRQDSPALQTPTNISFLALAPWALSSISLLCVQDRGPAWAVFNSHLPMPAPLRVPGIQAFACSLCGTDKSLEATGHRQPWQLLKSLSIAPGYVSKIYFFLPPKCLPR